MASILATVNGGRTGLVKTRLPIVFGGGQVYADSGLRIHKGNSTLNHLCKGGRKEADAKEDFSFT